MCEMKSLDGSNPPLSANESPISGASQHAAIARVWGFIGCAGFPGILLTVGNVGLEHSNGARDQQYDDTQRNGNLHHSE
jgi:hypothetical protein